MEIIEKSDQDKIEELIAEVKRINLKVERLEGFIWTYCNDSEQCLSAFRNAVSED